MIDTSSNTNNYQTIVNEFFTCSFKSAIDRHMCFKS